MDGEQNGDSIATAELVIWAEQIFHWWRDPAIHEAGMHSGAAWLQQLQALRSERLVGPCLFNHCLLLGSEVVACVLSWLSYSVMTTETAKDSRPRSFFFKLLDTQIKAVLSAN